MPYVPGPVPYAPQTLSQAPEMGLSIADMMLRNANQAYAIKANMFNQLGQGVQGIGQNIVEGMRQDRLNKQAELDNQIKSAQLHELQYSQDARNVLGQAFAQHSNQDGTTDFSGVRQFLVDKGRPDLITPALKQSLDTNEAVHKVKVGEFQDQQANQDYWATMGKNLKERMQTDPDGGIAALGHIIQTTNLKTPFGQLPDVQQAAQTFSQASQAYQQAPTPQAKQQVAQQFQQMLGPMADHLMTGASQDLQGKWVKQAQEAAQAQKDARFTAQPGETIGHIGPDGKPVIDIQGGQKPLSAYEAAELGNKRQALDLERWKAAGGIYSGLPMPGGGGAAAPAGGGVPGTPTGNAALEGNDFLKTLPPSLALQVKGMAEGRMQVSPRMISTPAGQALLDATMRYDPTFDATQWTGRVAARRDFSSGKSQDAVGALNQALSHMDRLDGSIEKLGNLKEGTLGPLTGLANSTKNAYNVQSGKPELSNLLTDANAVSNELTRLWRGTGGSEKDIQDWKAGFGSAGSPEIQHGKLTELANLVQGAVDKLEERRKILGAGGGDIQILTPKSRAILDRLKAGGGPSTIKIGNLDVQVTP